MKTCPAFFRQTCFAIVLIVIHSIIASSVHAQQNLVPQNKQLVVANDRNLIHSFKIEGENEQIVSLEIKRNGLDVAVKLFVFPIRRREVPLIV